MNFHNSSGVCYYTFPSLEEAGVTAAVFTRIGGVSPAPWNTLNVGGTVGDDQGRVNTNRELVFKSMNRPSESIFDVWQVHSTNVIRTDRPRPLNQAHQKADGMLTNNPEVTFFMRFADCVPILLFDRVHQAIGLVHSGWMGTVNWIGKAAVEEMGKQFETNPRDILACIGPSICVDHYPVGIDVANRVRQSFNSQAGRLLKKTGENVHFDLWGANQTILQEAGVEKIELSGICTACHPNEWFSHRGEKGKTGRFGVLFALGV